jgi:predicted secreted protein
VSSDVEVVDLRAGDEHVVRLAQLGAAGYSWTPEVEGDASVASVEASGTSAPAGGATGASGEQAFTIRALGPGRARVRFAQRRPWEAADQPPAAEHIVDVRVSREH